ncbi:hypothetical protein [Methanoregula sp.]
MVKRLISTYFEDGTVKSVKKGPVSTEVVITIAGGSEMVSYISQDSLTK